MAPKLDLNYIARLVRLAQGGDSNAFAELYMATFDRLYHFSCHYLKDPYMAQDAVQETYIKALQHINQVHDPMLVVAWLNQINMRVCNRMIHRNARVQVTDDARIDVLAGQGLDAEPENEVVRIDYNEYLMKQVMSLPFTESQALLLRYYHNMPIREIADTLGISGSTVKRNIRSGVEHLKKLVNP